MWACPASRHSGSTGDIGQDVPIRRQDRRTNSMSSLRIPEFHSGSINNPLTPEAEAALRKLCDRYELIEFNDGGMNMTTIAIKIISIAKDFSETPGPRARDEGEFSGEEFLQDILRPAYMRAVQDRSTLTVDLDGTEGYATSFLEATFGGLAREFDAAEINKVIKFKSDDEPFLISEIKGYIADARNTPDAEAALTKWADKYNLVRYSATYKIYLLVALGELFQRTVEAAAKAVCSRCVGGQSLQGSEHYCIDDTNGERYYWRPCPADAIRHLTVEQVLEEK